MADARELRQGSSHGRPVIQAAEQRVQRLMTLTLGGAGEVRPANAPGARRSERQRPLGDPSSQGSIAESVQRNHRSAHKVIAGRRKARPKPDERIVRFTRASNPGKERLRLGNALPCI